MNIRILESYPDLSKARNLYCWDEGINHSILLIYPMKNCFTFNLLDKKL